MANKGPTNHRTFRSVSEVKREYLPTLQKSRNAEDVQQFVERAAEITEQTLRKHLEELRSAQG